MKSARRLAYERRREADRMLAWGLRLIVAGTVGGVLLVAGWRGWPT